MSESTKTYADNGFSRFWQKYKKFTGNPIGSSFLLGGVAAALSEVAWKPIVSTAGVLGRIPGKKLTGMNDIEWANAIEDLKNNRKWLPYGVGGLTLLASLASSYNPKRVNAGLTSWEAPIKKPVPSTADFYNDSSLQMMTPKIASLYSSGYVPKNDFNAAINGRDAIGLFTNDPTLQNNNYVRNLGTSIIADASIRSGTSMPSLGSVFDSAVNKIENKLSFEGLASVGIKTVVANSAANLFTSAVGGMLGLPKPAQDKLIEAGTWAGAITAILE